MTSVNGRVIGLAHHAGRAVAERVVGRHGLSFLGHLALRAAITQDGPLAPEELAGRLTHDLKGDHTLSQQAVDSLTAQGYLEYDDAWLLRPTDAGRDLFATVTTEVAEVSARLYAGLSEEELAVTGRVLELVTERANAELAEPAA
ncbi:MarR family transcriptional regulator [Streptomyces roseirectus]|uniref:MarR family transcriptional regulator n=1 Tax=Streptomyces roseirectus TaxID=2768066 RepID=A0A7H0ING9_9ACTN|nr:MarR family transcriptional regulator [Streptomyces roseirectus]QNP74335.1 MarR family transcriptional regulator [Streptomyces roseirectus]